MSVPRLSVVIPTHARREAVLRLLHSLARQTVDPDLFDVVVAVDGDEDGTAQAVEAHVAPFRLRHVAQPHGGRASACNLGARSVEGELILFLDDDMEATPGLLAAHMEAHVPGTAVGVVGAAPIVVTDSSPPIVRYRERGFARKMEQLASRRDNLAFTDVYTGNFSVRRDLFLVVHGYDEEFWLYGHEDYDLSLRLGREGVRFVFDEAAAAHQHYAKSFRALAANTIEEGSSAVQLAIKHPEAVPALQLSHYGTRSRRKRWRLAMLLARSREHEEFLEHAIASVEEMERRTEPHQYPELFARYDLIFDLLYWLGVERALGDAGMPRRTPFGAVERRIAEARARQAGVPVD